MKEFVCRWLLIFVVAISVLAKSEVAPLGGHAFLSKESTEDLWATNFPAALAAAETDHRPLIVVLGARKCVYCSRLERALSGADFRSWVREAGVHLVWGCVNETNSCPAQMRMYKFLAEMNPPRHSGYPYVGVYWPKTSEDIFQMSFSGRRGEMPGAKDASLFGEFTNAMGVVLGDYLRTRTKHYWD